MFSPELYQTGISRFCSEDFLSLKTQLRCYLLCEALLWPHGATSHAVYRTGK